MSIYCDSEWNVTENNLNVLIDKGCKLIVITNPNSYTGKSIPRKVLDNFIKKCNEKEILVVIDEVYKDFAKEDCSQFIDEYNNLICIRSFSKSLGVAGLRVGYILSNSEVIKYLYRNSFGVEINSVAAKIVEFFCDNPKYYEQLVNNIIDSKKKFVDKLISIGVSPVDTDTNFIPIKIKERDKLVKYLKENNVRVRIYPHMENFKEYISVTVGNDEIIDKVISLLESFVNSNKEI